MNNFEKQSFLTNMLKHVPGVKNTVVFSLYNVVDLIVCVELSEK